jgi:SNF2 family DNA or RNA helicase
MSSMFFPYSVYLKSLDGYTDFVSHTVYLQKSQRRIRRELNTDKPIFIRYTVNQCYLEQDGLAMFYLPHQEPFSRSFRRFFLNPDNEELYRFRLEHMHSDSRTHVYELRMYFKTEHLEKLHENYADTSPPPLLLDTLTKRTEPPVQYSLTDVTGTSVDLKRPLMAHQQKNLSWLKECEEHGFSQDIPTLPFNHSVRNFPFSKEPVILDWNSNTIVSPSAVGGWEKNKLEILGGVMADEVGLGKTTSMISLMVARSCKTLIICPARLCKQWQSEIGVNTDKLKPFVIGTIVQYKKALKNFDAYDTWIAPFRFFDNKSYVKESEKPGAFLVENHEWGRVVVDESHEILSSFWNLSATQRRQHRKIIKTKGKYRWLVTGTPGDFGPALEFLAGKELEKKDYIFQKNLLIKTLFRRNTMITAGVKLPGISTSTDFLDFTEDERAIYNTAFDCSRRQVQLCTHLLMSDHYRNVIGGQPMTIEEVREKMKAHYQSRLVREEARLPNIQDPEEKRRQLLKIQTLKSKISIFSNFQDTQDTCPICLEVPENMAVTTCGHNACKGCIQHMFQNCEKIKCPMCRTYLKKSDIMVIDNKQQVQDTEVEDENKWGTKMTHLIKYLNTTLKNPEARVILVSCWNRMLKMVGAVLGEKKIEHVYLEGSTYGVAKSIERFKTNDKIRVVMMAADKAASGINLTEGTHIVLLDTVNAHNAQTVEEQAIARSVRMGQTHEVTVKRFIMRNTVEHDNYLKMQQGAAVN